MWFYEIPDFYPIVTCYVGRFSPRAQRVSKVAIGTIPLGLDFHSLICIIDKINLT